MTLNRDRRGVGDLGRRKWFASKVRRRLLRHTMIPRGLYLLVGLSILLGVLFLLPRGALRNCTCVMNRIGGAYDATGMRGRQGWLAPVAGGASPQRGRLTCDSTPSHQLANREQRIPGDCLAATVDVLTQHNDAGRTGANLSETILNTTDVNVKTFGRVFTRPVDGQIYAQPLYVSSLNIPNKGIHNVVFVATMHDGVYAFDADDPAASTPLWKVTLGASIPVTNADFGGHFGPYHDISVEIGIVSTPVIDRATDTIYALAANRDGDGRYVHRLHALDLLTGAEKFGGPVETQGSVPGTGAGSVGGTVTFDNKQQLQRAGLLLANGLVYVAFAGYADTDPYHGWILAYDAHTLRRVAIFNDTPNSGGGGIWQSGWGLAADANGDVYAATSNGDRLARIGGLDYADSYLKLNASLAVDDWFTPWDVAAMASDQDLGSTGLMLIPGTNLLFSGDKDPYFFVLNRDHMGHFNGRGDTQIVQRFRAATGPIQGGIAFWDGPSGAQVYVWSAFDSLKALRLVGGMFQITPVSQSANTIPHVGWPGGMLSVSAHGSAAGSGIVWALCPDTGDATFGKAMAILRAFDASDLRRELWNSRQDVARDDVGRLAKFDAPTIANGKVYVPTFSGYLAVYGLLPTGP